LFTTHQEGTTVRLFQGIAALLPAAAFAATCGGHGTHETTFVSTQWLADHLTDKNLVILAIGTDEKEFEQAHIPGSVFFDYHDSHEMKSAAGLSTELPPMEVLAKNFAKYGVANDSRVVLYWLKDWWSPTGRVYLTLDAMGLGAQTSVLNGGLPAWQTEKRAIATGAAPAPESGKLTPCAQDDVIAKLDYVKSSLQAPGVRIVDARDPKVYSGENERAGVSAGHIEGAANVFYNSLLDDNGKLKPDADLKKLFTDAGIKPGDRVVTYCFIGQQASALYTVARYLGYDARLYDGSMDEWTKHPELPIVNPHKK
jgi:thiosulfate/3-mercaptopyruvate sulfurtransferase